MAISRSYGVLQSEELRSSLRRRLFQLRSLNLPRIVAVVLIGWLLGRFVTMSSSYFVIAAVVALVCGMLLIRNLGLGLIGYTFVAALAFGESPGIQSPHSGYSAGLLPCEIVLGFLAFLWLLRSVFTTGVRLVKSELNLPMIALGVVAIISLITNNVFRGTRELLFHQLPITQVAEVGLLWFSITAFFLAANTWNQRKWLESLFVPVVLYGLYFSAHRIVGFRFPVPIVWGSFLLSAAIAFVYARLLFHRNSRGQSISLIAFLLIMLLAAFKSLAWVSGWMAAILVVMVISFYRSRVLAGVLTVLALFALFVWPGVYQGIHSESQEGGDFDRFTIWHDAFDMFLGVSPVFGVGPGNYHPYVYYHNTLWFGSQTYTTAHSNYVQMAAELGLLGLVVFIWVILSGIRVGHQSVRGSPPELRWLAVAATAVFTSMAVASFLGDYMFPSRGNNGIVNFGTTVYTWLIIGAAAAAASLPHQSEEMPS